MLFGAAQATINLAPSRLSASPVGSPGRVTRRTTLPLDNSTHPTWRVGTGGIQRVPVFGHNQRARSLVLRLRVNSVFSQNRPLAGRRNKHRQTDRLDDPATEPRISHTILSAVDRDVPCRSRDLCLASTMSSSAVAGLSGPPSASPLILPPSAGLHNAAQGISGDRSVTVAIGRIIRTCRNGKRDGSDIGNRGKQTWAVTSRWPPRPAARCPADPASGTPIPGRDAWQSVSAIPSRHTAAPLDAAA